MARPKKQTVDYFPHSCTHGKTIYILERKWGNDGYAFWFKLLEALGGADGHFIDCGDINQWEYLVATSGIDDEICEDILAKLAGMGKIDEQLWEEKRVIWSDAFIAGISDVYSKRTAEIPLKEDLLIRYSPDSGVSGVGNSQSIVKYSKVNETKVEVDDLEVILNPEDSFSEFYAAYPKKKSKEAAKKKWKTLKVTQCLFVEIMTGLATAKVSQDWIKDGGQFIPHPSTWLNQKRWEDEDDDLPGPQGNQDSGSFGSIFAGKVNQEGL
ncbi:DUF4373 domain-containing protein [Candidatus Pacearchaeota archaeon]|nr:DUF4373 domain-containing protein [Candidatus Pacearchaeota archaeon]